MTNLSKELCEICGIKRKRKIFDQGCDDTCKYLDKTDVYDPCKRGENPCPTYIKYVYPDFEKPENFVKLLKIANDVLGSVHFATAYTKNKPGIFEEQVLLHYLPIAKLNEGFKRAIRAEEWVYE